jgi:hypothetical protein
VGEPETLNQRWLKWKNELNIFLLASGVKDNEQKKAILLHAGGPGLREIELNFSADQKAKLTEDQRSNPYSETVALFDEHFTLKRNIPKARQNFLTSDPKPGETVNNFVIRLKTLASYCDYEDSDSQVRDHVLRYIKDKQLMSKLLNEDTLTLDRTLAIISNHHNKEALILNPTSANVNRVSQHSSHHVHQQHPKPQPRHDRSTARCYRCNAVGHYGKECKRSKNHTCEKCGNIGHFAECCKTKETKPKGYKRSFKKSSHSVRQVDSQEPASDEDESHVFALGSGTELKVLVNGTELSFIVDSGCEHDLLSETDYRKLQSTEEELKPSNKRLVAYAAEKPLQTLGDYTAQVSLPNHNEEIWLDFTVIANARVSLLGWKTSQKYGLLSINTESINQVDDCWGRIQTNYPQVFTGLGKLKNYELKLQIDPNVKPVIQSHRRVPFSRRAKVEEKIDELKKLDVIEPVTKPTNWVNPLVTVEKPGGGIRMCLDMRRANEAIVRERHPIPTLEETIQEMSGGKVFSKLDLNMAYHQIALSPESRDITTFATPTGLYRYKRLLFGVNMATEKFQAIISQVIAGCDGAYNISDDIIVVARTNEEHDRRLEAVIRRLAEHGLTLNAKKSKIKATSIEYMGHILTDGGLRVAEKKVDAVLRAATPTNASQVRSFLGLAQFSAKFIPHFATISSPLWDLTAKDAEWKWTGKEQTAFDRIKSALAQAPVMAYFNQGLPIRITTDASPVGLGAILEQQQTDGHYSPVYYASRKLTPVETRYSQFEREALAVYWATKKFSLYLVGNNFEVRTDNKALVSALSSTAKPASARLERWLLHLQQFSYTLTHTAGSLNQADALSRLPLPEIEEHNDGSVTVTEYVYSVIKDAVPVALNPKQIEDESSRDDTLSLVRRAIETEDWKPLKGTLYKAIKDELWTAGKLLMRGKRIVMPQSLWQQTLKLAHEGHQGVVRTKSRLREKVWWPSMAKHVEEMIKRCHPCQLNVVSSKLEPFGTPMKGEKPWSDVAVDLLDIPETNTHLLVLIDSHSKWPEAIPLTNTTAPDVVRALQGIFITHGLPTSLRSDNGPPFNSRIFTEYLEENGIEHHKGIPYWPRSNGEVERLNGTLLKSIRIAKQQQKDWKMELKNFLLQYRTTPHTTTGISPAEMLMGRKLRTKLPMLATTTDELTKTEEEAERRDQQALRKLRSTENAQTNLETSDIQPGDLVFAKNFKRTNKLSAMYEAEPYLVIRRNGSALELRRGTETKMRNVAHVKRCVTTPAAEDEEPTPIAVAEDEAPTPLRNETAVPATPLRNDTTVPALTDPPQQLRRSARTPHPPGKTYLHCLIV